MVVIRIIQRVIRKAYGLYQRQCLGFKRCGSGVNLARPYVINGANNIVIGKNFLSMGSLYLYGHEGEITIGNNVSVNTNVQIGSSGASIKIGDNVLIGPNVVLRAADHNISEKSRLINEQGHSGSPIVIEDDVWIGANSVVLKGVWIKRGAVINAGSVVTKNVAEYAVVAGVPAKPLSYR